MRKLVTALVAVAMIAGCSSDDPGATGPTTTTTTPLAGGTLGGIELATEEVADLDEPIALAARPGSADLYIAEKAGRVRLVEVTTEEPADGAPGEVTYEVPAAPLLDISAEVAGVPGAGGERGLLGLVFSADGRRLYLDYTRRPDGATVVVEYTMGEGSSIDESSRRELLVVDQPFPQHNGGQLVLGPDGLLYIGLGDGGEEHDEGDPFGHGQDTTTLLGSILRIDPEGGAEGEPPYAIPPGNPFADGDQGQPEIWLYGVRNPWRFSFDTATGDLWVADVGQTEAEEINRLPATGGVDAGRGANLGWNEMEGSHPFRGGENPPGGVLPTYEYSHEDGCAISGGYVYRGDQIPDLQGTYLFADYCFPGVRGLQLDGETVIDERTWDLPVEQIYSFGQDADGELYALLASGPVLKLTGPPPSDTP